MLISFQNALILHGISKNFKFSDLQQVNICGFSDISYGGLKSLELKLLLFCRSKAKTDHMIMCYFSCFVCLFFT